MKRFIITIALWGCLIAPTQLTAQDIPGLEYPVCSDHYTRQPNLTDDQVTLESIWLNTRNFDGFDHLSYYWGEYLIDDVMGTAEGGESSDAVDQIVAFSPDGQWRGGAQLDSDGFWYLNIISSDGEQGLPLTLVVCDFQKNKVVQVEMTLDPAHSSQQGTKLVVNQNAVDVNSGGIRLIGNAYPSDMQSWEDVNLGAISQVSAGADGLKSMTMTAYVTLHGEASKDPNGTLVTFWQGEHPVSDEFKSWVSGVSQPYEDPHGVDRMLYDITIHGYEWGDEITFAQIARDPRTLIDGHFGIGRDLFNFIPNSNLGNTRYPVEIVLLHPPFLESELPGEIIRQGESFQPIDLSKMIVDPTGQQIDFRITGMDGLTAYVDSLDMLHINYREGWSGTDRLRLEATHDTRELTIREASYVVVDESMRFPYWSNPAPGTFAHQMRVIAAFYEESGVTLDHYPVAGAFENQQLRGTSTAVDYQGQARMIIDVFSDNPGADISFVGYTVEHDNFLTAALQIPFQPGATIGTLDEPVRLGFIVTDVDESVREFPERISIDAAYPNPAQEKLNLHYNLVESSPVKIWLVDMTGRKKLLRDVARALPGSYHHIVDVSGVASALYRVQVETNHGSVSKSVVVIRQ